MATYQGEQDNPREAPTSADYNQGQKDDRREALRGAVDYTKLLTTLATGTLVLSATVLDNFYAGHGIPLLIISWSALGLSILIGLIAIGESISQFAESTLIVRRGTMEVASLVQWLLLIVGVGLFGAFVISNVTAAPGLEIERDRSGVVKGTARTTVVCPSDAANGCTGTTTFQLLGSPHGRRHVDLGTAAFASGHPGLITVRSPRSLSAALKRSLAHDRLRITVEGHGRYGNARTVEETVAAEGKRTAR